MKLELSKKLIINFLRGFSPSKYILVISILFYILGIVFAFMNEDQARLIFANGMFLNNIEAQIQIYNLITVNYVINQFIYYFGAVSLKIFINNSILMILCIFTGVAIFPVILIGLLMKMGAITFFVIEKLGFSTGLLVLLGSFHIYFEILAALLAIDAFFNFYGSFINSIRQLDVTIFKKSLINEFIPLFIRILLLLALAAILEVFWSTWWVYIITNHYISWHDFYFGAYSVLLK